MVDAISYPFHDACGKNSFRMRKILDRACRGAVALFAGALLVVYVWGIVDTAGPLPSNVRNSAENVGRIRPAAPGPYRFAVVGDPQNAPEVLNRTLRKMKERPPDFVVILGDLVHYAQPWTCQYFLHRFRAFDFQVPVFAALGNHDLSWWRLTRRGQYGLFWEHFGPENFFFHYRGSLFVLLDNANGAMPYGTGPWLERVLETHARSAEHVFLFAHCPLVRYTETGGVNEPPGPPQDGELWNLIRKYDVRYFCAGHVHSYRRAVLENGTVHLVSGGGGGLPHGEDAFYHFVEFEVDGPRVTDRVVRVEPPGPLALAKQETEKAIVRDVFLRLRNQREWEIAVLSLCLLSLLTLRLRALQRKPPAQ